MSSHHGRSEHADGRTIYLFRHGQTVWAAADKYVGSSDIDLDETGRSQAQDLAAWAKDKNLSAVVSSPLKRARDTAAPTASELGLEVVVQQGLEEADFGRCEGLSPGEIEKLYPGAYALFQDNPVKNPLPGQEDMRDVAKRGAAALNRVLEQTEGDVLIVCHGTLLRLVTCSVLGIDVARYRDVFPVVKNGNGATLKHREDDNPLQRWGLLSFNG